MKAILCAALVAITLIPSQMLAGEKVRSASGVEFAPDGYRAVTFSMW